MMMSRHFSSTTVTSHDQHHHLGGHRDHRGTLHSTYPSKKATRRRLLTLISISTTTITMPSITKPLPASSSTINTSTTRKKESRFFEIPNSGGVKVLDLRIGTSGDTFPSDGDRLAVHYYGRLAAKQGWRFDSTYDHKDSSGEPVPFIFTLGSSNVIKGIETAVRTMKVGGIRRVVIPPSQGYRNTTQEPIPPNYFDRQRLFTTIFNPTRLANGEGSTLGTLVFDIELVSVRHPPS